MRREGPQSVCVYVCVFALQEVEKEEDNACVRVQLVQEAALVRSRELQKKKGLRDVESVCFHGLEGFAQWLRGWRLFSQEAGWSTATEPTHRIRRQNRIHAVDDVITRCLQHHACLGLLLQES